MHVSLDGFVSGPSGELDWSKLDEELFDHVGKRIKTGDTALYGRITYQMMESYWPTAADKPTATPHDRAHSQWYKQVRKLVLSRTLEEPSDSNTEIISTDLTNRLRDIKAQDGEDILLFGSPTATHALIKEQLIDGYWLFVHPVLLGEGIPLFREIPYRTPLKLISSRTFASGVAELDYRLERR
jgi:dihydrofolate reductase